MPDTQITDAPFGDKLSALCAVQLTVARKDPEAMGEMIERLINSLAFTIAIACKGDPKGMGDMIAGAEAHLNEQAASHARAARILEDARNVRR